MFRAFAIDIFWQNVDLGIRFEMYPFSFDWLPRGNINILKILASLAIENYIPRAIRFNKSIITLDHPA